MGKVKGKNVREKKKEGRLRHIGGRTIKLRRKKTIALCAGRRSVLQRRNTETCIPRKTVEERGEDPTKKETIRRQKVKRQRRGMGRRGLVYSKEEKRER